MYIVFSATVKVVFYALGQVPAFYSQTICVVINTRMRDVTL